MDLLRAGAGEDDIERRLVLCGSGAVAARRSTGCGDRNRSSGGDTPLVLDLLLQLDQVEDRHLPELVEHLVDRACSHLLLLLFCLSLDFRLVWRRMLAGRHRTLWL